MVDASTDDMADGTCMFGWPKGMSVDCDKLPAKKNIPFFVTLMLYFFFRASAKLSNFR